MSKIGFRYFQVDPWAIIEQGFDLKQARVAESVFSLANEFMGVRGYFEEGYSGDHLQGSYFGGIYENKEIGHPQVFKGFITRENFIVNSVDWLYTRIKLEGEGLDLHTSKFTDFVRRLDLKKGILTRELVWHTSSGKQLKIRFERFLSMVNNHLGCQRITFQPLNFSGEIQVSIGLNFSTVHEIAAGWDMRQITGTTKEKPQFSYWDVLRKEKKDGIYAIQSRTKTTQFSAFSSFQLRSEAELDPRPVEDQDFIGCDLRIAAEQGKAIAIDRIVINFWERPKVISSEQVWEQGMALAVSNRTTTFDQALSDHIGYWQNKWQNWDIEINGDEELQQGVRFDLFQFHSTYHGGDSRLAIPSKGLTAEVYSGWIFWVVETYCQHVMIFTDPKAARKLLHFRYLGLDAAIERARQVDCEGARYPFCTIDGPESCATWQHADMEIHVGLGIFFAIWLYTKHTKDFDFLYGEGIEMLLQICRFYASRGGWSPINGDFGFYGVMGPDEYKTLVNHNCYTNWMAKKLFNYTLDVVAEMERQAPEKLESLKKKAALQPSELIDWKRKADSMRILRDETTGVYEQHDGYFDLPEVDVKSIGPDQIPIYNHWAYERLFRVNMIKQADVLLLPVWFSHEWSFEEKKANFEFYEPRTIHESSFSPSIHAILAAELGKIDMAYQFFQLMARLDLDNYNCNTAQGLHITPKSGTWMCIVYGFAGMRTDLEILTFQPVIPEPWRSYRFRIVKRNAILEVNVDQKAATFKLISGEEVPIKVYGLDYIVNRDGIKIPLQPVGQSF